MDRLSRNRNKCTSKMVYPHFGLGVRARIGPPPLKDVYLEDIAIKRGPCDSYFYENTSDPNPAKWPYRKERSVKHMTKACQDCMFAVGDVACSCVFPSPLDQESFDEYSACVKKSYEADKEKKKLENVRRCANSYHTIFDDCPNITDSPHREACSLDLPRPMPYPY